MMKAPFNCHFCGGSMFDNGALLFSPPMGKMKKTIMYHVCKDCYVSLYSVLKQVARKYATNTK